MRNKNTKSKVNKFIKQNFKSQYVGQSEAGGKNFSMRSQSFNPDASDKSISEQQKTPDQQDQSTENLNNIHREQLKTLVKNVSKKPSHIDFDQLKNDGTSFLEIPQNENASTGKTTPGNLPSKRLQLNPQETESVQTAISQQVKRRNVPLEVVQEEFEDNHQEFKLTGETFRNVSVADSSLKNTLANRSRENDSKLKQIEDN